MPYLSINPDSEPYLRRRLAADIQGRVSVNDLTPEELAESFNLIESMECEVPKADQRTEVYADYHEGDEDEDDA